MWFAAAEEAGALDAALITAVWTFLGIVVTTLGLILGPVVKSRFDRTSPPVPAPAAAPLDGGLLRIAKDQGALVQRADDNDDRDNMQDKRIAHLERWAERHDPAWWAEHPRWSGGE